MALLLYLSNFCIMSVHAYIIRVGEAGVCKVLQYLDCQRTLGILLESFSVGIIYDFHNFAGSQCPVMRCCCVIERPYLL